MKFRAVNKSRFLVCVILNHFYIANFSSVANFNQKNLWKYF